MSNHDKSKTGGLLDALSEWGKAATPSPNGISTVPPPPQSSSSSAAASLHMLAQYLTRPEAKGMYYNSKIIKLDGFKFIGCRFDNCTLVVSSPNFELEECVIDPSTVVEFSADPLKIIRLFNNQNDWAYKTTPEFAPSRNANGTITINGASR